MRKVVSITVLLLSLYSCGKTGPVSPMAYVQYLEQPEHDCRKAIDAGGMQYTIQLATPEYMAGKELADKDGHVDKTSFDKRLRELNGYTFFLVKMARKNKSGTTEGTSMADQAHADQMVMYYEQAAAADISLQQGASELKPVTYHFENNYGLSPENTIVIGFETGTGKPQDLTLIFNDRYTNTPMIKAGFDTKTLTQLPTIQL